MKILHVIKSLAPRYGGTSIAIKSLCRELARRGHYVAIFTTNKDGRYLQDVPLGRYVEEDSYLVKYFPVQWPRFYTVSVPLARALRNETKEFDIVHISTIYNFHLPVAGYYCRKFNIPYIVHVHGVLDPFLRKHHRFRKWVYHKALLKRDLDSAAAIFYSTYEEMVLVKPIGIRPPGVIIPNGIDPSEFDNLPSFGSFRCQYPQLKDKKIILFLSRINYKKGLDILAQAYGEVLQRRGDIFLVITGPADNKRYVKKVKGWLKKEQAFNQTIFTGMLTGKEKLAVLRDSDVFVLPSYTENFGIAVVEAMASGLPIIISNKVNIWREVAQANAGRIIDCDSTQLAQSIIELLDNKNLRCEMGQKGVRLVNSKYTWPKVAEQTIGVYQDILRRDSNK